MSEPFFVEKSAALGGLSALWCFAVLPGVVRVQDYRWADIVHSGTAAKGSLEHIRTSRQLRGGHRASLDSQRRVRRGGGALASAVPAARAAQVAVTPAEVDRLLATVTSRKCLISGPGRSTLRNGMLLEFVVFGVPVSTNSKNPRAKAAWKSLVAESARAAVNDDDFPLLTRLQGTLIYFHQHDVEVDVDNMVKATLDGAVGIVYGDDSLIDQITVRKTDIRGVAMVRPTRVLTEALEKLTSQPMQPGFMYLAISDEPVHHEVLP